MKIKFLIIIVIGVVLFGFAIMTFNFDQNNSQEQLPMVIFSQGTIKIDKVFLDVQIADTEPGIVVLIPSGH